MKNFFYLTVFIFLAAQMTIAEESGHREKRQIYYQDIQNRPKTFRSRGPEKEELERETDANLDLESLNLSEEFSFTSQYPSHSYEKDFKSRPGKSYVTQPSILISEAGSRPVYEERSFKPKPAYEEPYIPKPAGHSFHQNAQQSYQEPLGPKSYLHKTHEPSYQPPHKPKSNYHEPFATNSAYNSPHHNPKQAYKEPFHSKASVHMQKSAYEHLDYKPNDVKEKHEKKNPIPGEAGKDYPIYNEVPYTSFSCKNVPYKPGMYANVEARCQAYHVCNDDRHGQQGASFLCTNGTLFNQESFSCDWWYNVDCDEALSYYDLNTDPKYNPYYQKPYVEDDKEEIPHQLHSRPVGVFASPYKPKASYRETDVSNRKHSTSSHSESHKPYLRPYNSPDYKPYIPAHISAHKPSKLTHKNPVHDAPVPKVNKERSAYSISSSKQRPAQRKTPTHDVYRETPSHPVSSHKSTLPYETPKYDISSKKPLELHFKESFQHVSHLPPSAPKNRKNPNHDLPNDRPKHIRKSQSSLPTLAPLHSIYRKNPPTGIPGLPASLEETKPHEIRIGSSVVSSQSQSSERRLRVRNPLRQTTKTETREIKSKASPNNNPQRKSFEFEEKFEKSKTVIQESEVTENSSSRDDTPSYASSISNSGGKRKLRRRKRPRPSKTSTNEGGSILTRSPESQIHRRRFQVTKAIIEEAPEHAIVDYEWGSRST